MKYIYLFLAALSAVIGSIGIILPILPTTPFFLLTIFFLSRGSKEATNWFKSTTFYELHVRDFVKLNEISLSNKCFILAFASLMLIISFILVDIWYIRVFLIFLFIYKYFFFLFQIKTPRDPSI